MDKGPSTRTLSLPERPREVGFFVDGRWIEAGDREIFEHRSPAGWGREAGMYGVEEYTQLKSVHIATGPRAMWAV